MKLTCSGGFGDDLAGVGVVDHEDFRDGDEEESAVGVVGAAVLVMAVAVNVEGCCRLTSSEGSEYTTPSLASSSSSSAGVL